LRKIDSVYTDFVGLTRGLSTIFAPKRAYKRVYQRPILDLILDKKFYWVLKLESDGREK